MGTKHSRESTGRPARHLSPKALSSLLEHGRVTSCDLLPRGSNYVFVAQVLGENGDACRAIYKPRDGENPLWDFPSGSLCLRERAAYVLAEALGWRFVPLTIVRDGPHGVGSMQAFVDHDPRRHYFTLRDEHPLEFQRMFVFDWLANNADRKAGHCLLSSDGAIWGIDHGLTFHAAPKLRTVIWDFAGLPVPDPILAAVEQLVPKLDALDGPLAELRALLRNDELAALKQRLEAILTRRRFLDVHEGGVPWPWL